MASRENGAHCEGWQQVLLQRIQGDMQSWPQATPASTPSDELPLQGLLEDAPPRPTGPDGAWHRRDFVALDAQDFVHWAYRLLLGREADPDGLRAYEPWCATWLGRAALLQQLAVSAEGRRIGVRLVGCRLPYRLWRLARGRLRGLLNSALLAWDAEAFNQGQLRRMARSLEHVAGALRQYVQGSTAQLVREVQTWRTVDGSSALLDHERSLQTLQHQLQAVQGRLEELRALAAGPTSQTAAGTPPSSEMEEVAEAFYVAFEDACRGKTLDLWAKLEPYLEVLPPAPARVVDLGCGRGEWLLFLQAKGYAVLGVEPNGAMVQRCHQAGLPVAQLDGLTWLHAQADASVEVLTAFQVVEHIPFAQLLLWLREAARVLRPGGRLIVETPNPENVLVGSHTFYHDPTHRNPLTPTLLCFALEYCGLKVEKVLRLNPYPPEARVPGDDALTARVNGHFCGPQDFAVIGVRP